MRSYKSLKVLIVFLFELSLLLNFSISSSKIFFKLLSEHFITAILFEFDVNSIFNFTSKIQIKNHFFLFQIVYIYYYLNYLNLDYYY